MRVIRWYVIIVLLIVVALLDIYPIEFNQGKYFGCFRYKLISNRTLMDNLTGVAIEPVVFSCYYKYPYLYAYGITGYSKMDVIPFGGDNLKVVNKSYYDTLPEEKYSYTVSNLNEIKESHLSNIQIYSSFDSIQKQNILVFKQIMYDGEDNRGKYISYRHVSSLELRNMYDLRMKGLVSLNQSMEMIGND